MLATKSKIVKYTPSASKDSKTLK